MLLAAATLAMLALQLALRVGATAAAANQPIHLFTSASDVRRPWGLLQPIANTVKPIDEGSRGPRLGFPPSRGDGTCLFNGDKVLYIGRTGLNTPDSGPIEVFFVAGSKTLDDPSGVQRVVCRSVSSDDARTWSAGEVVIDGGGTPPGALTWFVNAQNMGRHPGTGEYQVRPRPVAGWGGRRLLHCGVGWAAAGWLLSP